VGWGGWFGVFDMKAEARKEDEAGMAEGDHSRVFIHRGRS